MLDMTINNEIVFFNEEHSRELIEGLKKYKSIIHYSLSFDSVMMSTDDLVPGLKRLLETTNPVILPYSAPIKVLVTSADVLHS